MCTPSTYMHGTELSGLQIAAVVQILGFAIVCGSNVPVIEGSTLCCAAALVSISERSRVDQICNEKSLVHSLLTVEVLCLSYKYSSRLVGGNTFILCRERPEAEGVHS